VLARFFAPAIGFPMAAAAVAAVHAATGWAPGHWLALHLAFVGGISQLVLGAGQFFAGRVPGHRPAAPGARRPAARVLERRHGAGCLRRPERPITT
jgi:hypothetical protein